MGFAWVRMGSDGFAVSQEPHHLIHLSLIHRGAAPL
jgi:hypothetical protein